MLVLLPELLLLTTAALLLNYYYYHDKSYGYVYLGTRAYSFAEGRAVLCRVSDSW